MEEIFTTQPEAEVQDTNSKTWAYSEKNNKHVTKHKITVTKNRFTHEAEISEAAQAMRQRVDISLKNVTSVNAYYGLSRNIRAVIILVLLAVVSLIGGAVAMFSGKALVGIGVAVIVLAALFGFIAWLVYRKIKPAFVLEIDTVLPAGTVKSNALEYGSASTKIGKKRHSLIFYLFLIVFWPLGVLYVLTHRSKGNKYVFEMSPEVGNEIVDTIGAFLIEE